MPQSPEPKRKDEKPRDSLEERLARAKTLQPAGRDAHCLNCWRGGRDAVVREIEGR